MTCQKRTYIKRLRRLSRFLRHLPRRKFDYGRFVTRTNEDGCGTVCCALGWMPAVDSRHWQWGGRYKVKGVIHNYNSPFTSAMEYFGISLDSSVGLFNPYQQTGIGYHADLPESATPKQVADLIDWFLAECSHLIQGGRLAGTKS